MGNNISYKIFLSEDGKYIIAKHWGTLNSKLILERTLEAHALGEKLNITRHLMDVTEATNTEPLIDTYKFAHKDVRRTPGIRTEVRVAVLVSPDDHSHDFAETVARNAGQDVTIFRDRESAIAHLIKDMPDR